jgi:hypothetical protein
MTTKKAIGVRRFKQLVLHAVELVEGGHSEGGMMFELIDEIDRLEDRPISGDRYAEERGWVREGEAERLTKGKKK